MRVRRLCCISRKFTSHVKKAASSLSYLPVLVIALRTAFVVINAETSELNVFTFQTQRERRLLVGQAALEGRYGGVKPCLALGGCITLGR